MEQSMTHHLQGFSSRSDDEGADVSLDSRRSRRWSSGGRKAKSGWEAEQLARQFSSEGGSESRGARRRPSASHRDNLSAQMDAGKHPGRGEHTYLHTELHQPRLYDMVASMTGGLVLAFSLSVQYSFRSKTHVLDCV